MSGLEQATSIEGDLYLHYSFIFDVNGEAADSPVCSSKQGELDSFGTLGDAEKTPLLICRGISDETTCNNNAETYSCAWSAVTELCYWVKDPVFISLSAGEDDLDLSGFNDMDDTGSGGGADVQVSVGLDLSMFNEIVLHSGRIPEGPSDLKVVGIECGLQTYLHSAGDA